jgi:ABC-type nitrate/sulfonate/bicarbonate transport system permease component
VYIRRFSCEVRHEKCEVHFYWKMAPLLALVPPVAPPLIPGPQAVFTFILRFPRQTRIVQSSWDTVTLPGFALGLLVCVVLTGSLCCS